jgi:hypothetical protein
MIRTDKINSMLKSERRREDHPQDRREFSVKEFVSPASQTVRPV